MYLPQFEKTYGSEVLKIRLLEKHALNIQQKISTHFKYKQYYLLKRTLIKALNTEQHRCMPDEGASNTTKCITEYLEGKIGCAMDLQGTNSLVPRLSAKLVKHTGFGFFNGFKLQMQ